MVRRLGVGGLLVLAAACGPRPEDGRLLLGPEDVAAFSAGGAGGPAGRLEVVPAEGPGFERALRLLPDSRTGGGRLLVEAAVPGAIEAGDVLSVSFSVRAAGQGGGRTEVRFEPGVSQWSSPLRMAARPGREWALHQYPFAVRRAYQPGEARLQFRSSAPVEIGGVRLVHYGKLRKKTDLPVTRLDYAGSGAGAAWRKAAAERIDRIRKAELAVTVKNEAGTPVEKARVRVRMKKHAFGFGTVVNTRTFNGTRPGVTPEDVPRYRDQLVRLYNKAVFEGEMKWPGWIQPQTRANAIETLKWLRGQGLVVRGHVLVWPSWRWLPEEARALKDSPEKLRALVREHVREEVTALRGQIVEWDVINEPYSNHDLMDILGREEMVEWFRIARRADPDAKLYLNDYDILTISNPKHRDHYEETLRYLLSRGAPLDGIGLQGHFKSEVTPPEEMLAVLDRFAAFGKALQVTEFDVDTVDEELQAGFTRDALTAVFSHPAAVGFLMWGFWEKSHWIPNGAMYRADWSAKPNAQAYEDLVLRQWWTDEEVSTDGGGRCAVRGFLGAYEIEVRVGDRVRKVEVDLPKEGATVAVAL